MHHQGGGDKKKKQILSIVDFIQSAEYVHCPVVYDIEVESAHNYFLDVGDNLLILAHNSSKTFSTLQWLIYLAINCKGPLMISVVSETLPHLRKGAERDFMRILGDAYSPALHNKTERIYHFGQNQIEFFSADQPSRVRGPRRDILYINECNNVSRETFDQLEIRTNSKVFLDFNPVQSFWAHDLLVNPDVSFDVSTYRDNQFLGPNIIKSIESRRYNPDGTETTWWHVYGAGQVGTPEGCILGHWQQIDEMPTQVDKITYGLDFGFSNDPSALVKVGITSDSVYVEELIYETGMTNDDIDVRMNVLGLNPRTCPIYADSAEPKSIEELRRKGWAIRPTVKGKDSIRVGLDYLKSRKLYVTKDSTNLIKELRQYVWETDSNGKATNIPIDDYNHAIDSLRYGLTYKIQSHEIVFKKVRF